MCGGCLVSYRTRFRLPGSLEEMSGRTWVLLLSVVLALITFGPMVIHFVQGALQGSLHTTSNRFGFEDVIS